MQQILLKCAFANRASSLLLQITPLYTLKNVSFLWEGCLLLQCLHAVFTCLCISASHASFSHVHCTRAQSCPTLCDPMDSALQAPLSTKFSRQEYWSGLLFPSSWDLPEPGMEPMDLASPALAGGFFTTVPPEKPFFHTWCH